MHRFALGILLAVVVALSRPVATGGAHDLLAVGVLVEEAPGKTRIALSVPTEEAVKAYDELLMAAGSAKPQEKRALSKVRLALLQGAGVHVAPPEASGGPRVAALVFYGVRSRAGRSPVFFDGSEDLPGAPMARAAATRLASAPATVTASAARILLASRDVEAVRDALEALAAVRADTAVAEAVALAEDPGRPPEHRVIAIRALRSLGGKAVAPEAFDRLAKDRDPLVAAEAAK